MPNLLESELRAVQHSIVATKKEMENCVNVDHYNKLEEALHLYKEEERRILSELGRNGGL